MSILQAITGGLGRFGTAVQGVNDRIGGALFAQDPAMQGVDPRLVEQQRRNAMLTLGLGMIAGRNQGRGFGEAALGSLQGAQQGFGNAMQTAYQNTERKRLENKADAREAAAIQRQDRIRVEDRDFETLKADRADARLDRELEGRKAIEELRARLERGVTNPYQAAQAQYLRRQLQELERLDAKRQKGEPLTPEEQRLYLELASGGRYSERAPNPLELLMGSGLGMPGMGTPPIAPGAGGNPLLNDPRL